MGRPQISAEGRRVIRLHIRLTRSEELRLMELATERGLTVSDFVRGIVLNSQPQLKKSNPERVALIRGLGELGKLGSNINQIAHELHSERLAGQGPRVSGEIITLSLEELRVLFRLLINLLSGGH